MGRLGSFCACVLAACTALSCGTVTRPLDDASTNGDGPTADAAPQPPPTPAREIVNGAGRVTSTTYTMDVEIGFSVGQQPAQGPTYKIEGNAAVKP